MNYWKDPGIRKDIIIGFAVAIITFILIEPLLNLIWRGILWFGENTYIGILNSIYKNAALGQRDWVVTLILFFMLWTPVLYMTTRAWTKKASKRPRISNKIWNIIGPLSLVGLILCVAFITTFTYADLQLTTSFEQRIVALSPYITDQQVKELRSSWAMMKTRDDYLEINDTLENLATENGVTLPKPLIK